jgi:hypothetical protein
MQLLLLFPLLATLSGLLNCRDMDKYIFRGWKTEIRRRDGKEMRVGGATKLTFTTMMAQSSGEAIELAYQAINADKVLPAGWIQTWWTLWSSILRG